MVVCKYWQQGSCRFGERCRFEHPSKSLHSQNRFGVFQSPESNTTNSPASGPFRGSSPNRTLPYHLNKDIIINDLSKERPLWILSAYGPGRNAPTQLFGGLPREQSFEEMRLHHYLAAASGNQTQAILEAQGLVNNAEQQIQTVLSDIDGAINYIVEGATNHPNRIDICKGQAGVVTSQPPAFGRPAPIGGAQPRTSSTFGQPSTSGNPTSTFGQPSSTFGQPSAFGRPQPTPFGQPSTTPGQPNSSFGQPSSTLGRPSTSFGQPSAPFGQASLGSGAPASSFGQPAAFGGTKPTPSAFGQPSGSGTVQQPTPSFGQPSNPFGQGPVAPPPQTASFDQPSQPVQPNAFGRTTSGTPSNSFGQSPKPTSSDPFGQPAAPTTNGIFAKPPSAPPPTTDGPSVQRDAQNKLTAWYGKPVSYIGGEPCYRRSDGSWERIWFPNGHPGNYKDIQLPDEAYDEKVKEAFMFMREHKAFKDGVMPDIPPKGEWCSWNF